MSGTADIMLADALKALNADPERAETLCRALLQSDANNGDARLVLSEALRRKGDLAGARAQAEAEARRRPQWFGAHRQLGVILAGLGEPLPASIALRKAAELHPKHPTIWRELGDQLSLAGDTAGAQNAYAMHAATGHDPKLEAAAKALRENDVATAEPILQDFLVRFPTDVVALKMLSEAQARGGRPDEAEQSLRRCLELAPAFRHARHSLGQLLMGLGRYEEAMTEAQRLLLQDPAGKGALRLQAAIHNGIGDCEKAAEIYERLLAADIQQPTIWMAYGHMLKTMGRTQEGIEAYRKSIAQAPHLGESYWSLANLKTFRFTAEETARMEAQLARSDLSATDRINMLYALGKAREDAGDNGGAFAAYSQGAALHRAENPYDATHLTKFVARSEAVFTSAFFAERAGQGCPAPDPIFIVGLPRSGSTLIEQILASHSAVEGTMELPDLGAIPQAMISSARALAGESYLDVLPALDSAALRAHGETYMRTTRIYRKLGRPFFINKTPNEFMHVGFIQLVLPNAKIIDARRHPMACGWSCFKQHFALGQNFTYDLADIGRFYHDYVRLMAHWDRVLPGRVHRVIHEELVVDPEPHIRALLDYCGLPFEEQCLRPHETKRAIKTPSAEQVRQPIGAGGLDAWQKFESWLDELRNALGPVLDSYPDAPPGFAK